MQILILGDKVAFFLMPLIVLRRFSATSPTNNGGGGGGAVGINVPYAFGIIIQFFNTCWPDLTRVSRTVIFVVRFTR